VRRPFHPAEPQGRYRLPGKVFDQLRVAVSGSRAAQQAMDLAHFLARFWSVPSRCGVVDFAIDRRALADRPDLGLSENAVRGAIRTLEAAGFIVRAVQAPGSRYRLNDAGTLQRRPILWQFAPTYLPLFLAANARAEAMARRPVQPARRDIGQSTAPRLAAPLFKRPAQDPAGTRAPKWEIPSGVPVNTGDRVQERLPTSRMAGPPAPSPLEAALARLADAIVKGDRS
jgi:biotin operon repressor